MSESDVKHTDGKKSEANGEAEALGGEDSTAAANRIDDRQTSFSLYKVDQATKRGGRITISAVQAAKPLKQQLTSKEIFVVSTTGGSVYLWQGKDIVAKTRKTGKQLFDDVRTQLQLPADQNIEAVKEDSEPEQFKALLDVRPDSTSSPAKTSATPAKITTSPSAKAAKPSPAKPTVTSPKKPAALSPQKSASSPKKKSAASTAPSKPTSTPPEPVKEASPPAGGAEPEGTATAVGDPEPVALDASTEPPSSTIAKSSAAQDPKPSSSATEASAASAQTATPSTVTEPVPELPQSKSVDQTQASKSGTETEPSNGARDSEAPKKLAKQTSLSKQPTAENTAPTAQTPSVSSASSQATAPAIAHNGQATAEKEQSTARSGQPTAGNGQATAASSKVTNSNISGGLGSARSSASSRPASAQSETPSLTLPRRSSREELKEGLRELDYRGHIKPSEAAKYFQGSTFIPAPQDFDVPAAAAKPATNLKLVPGQDTIAYSKLKGMRSDAGIDMTCKESYLSEEEFQEVSSSHERSSTFLTCSVQPSCSLPNGNSFRKGIRSCSSGSMGL